MDWIHVADRSRSPSSKRLIGGRDRTFGTLTCTSPPPPGGAPRLCTCTPELLISTHKALLRPLMRADNGQGKAVAPGLTCCGKQRHPEKPSYTSMKAGQQWRLKRECHSRK